MVEAPQRWNFSTAKIRARTIRRGRSFAAAIFNGSVIAVTVRGIDTWQTAIGTGNDSDLGSIAGSGSRRRAA
jgi:hypothetical protein